MNPARGGWFVLVTLLAALGLSAARAPLDWPEWLDWLRPGWMIMVMLFWVKELPHRIGLISAWILGFLVDIILAEPLGLNGLILATVTYIAWSFHERLRMYSVVQQAAVVMVLMWAGDLLRLAVHNIAAVAAFSWVLFVPGLVSAALWPLLAEVLTRARVRIRVE